MNYLNSLEPNAIVFCNGDNDTFPLWYAQEVEGVRPDVKIINLSYLASDWYANQMMQQTYSAEPVKFTARPSDIAYGRMDVTVLGRERAPADLLQSLRKIYAGKSNNSDYGYPQFPSSVVTIPVDREAVLKRGLVAAADTASIVNEIVIDLAAAPSIRDKGYVSLSELLMFDIIATNAAEGWPRPIYWCSTVGSEYHAGLTDYLRSTGMTHQLVPTRQEGLPARTDKAYGVVTNYKWGGADKATPGSRPYFDETARRMLVTTRNSMVDVVAELIYQGDLLQKAGDKKGAAAEYKKAVKTADLLDSRLSENVARYDVNVAMTLPDYYGQLGQRLGDSKLTDKARKMLWSQLERLIQFVRYQQNIAMTFGNVPLTIESQAMPYQYWRFIELYEQYGGDRRKTDELLKRNGLRREDLKAAYTRAYGPRHDDAGQYSEADYIRELSSVAKTVNELAALPVSEYAARPEDDRYLDSMYYEAYRQYIEAGISKEALDADPEIKKVDMDRSKRLYEAYSKK